MVEKEQKLSKIYHPHWQEFNPEQFSQAVSLFAGRLEANGFDRAWFKDKVCLDAGCGSGRYLQALVDLHAREVIGVDLNPAVAQERIKYPTVTILSGDIRKIPYPDGYFDFVCCNGVVHHTENPEAIIQELTRVLKKGGYLFLYVFDPDSVDWGVVDALRTAGQQFPMERFSALIQKYLNLPPNTLFNFMDLIYAPIQRKFTKEELKTILNGYEVTFLSKPFARYDSPLDNRLIAKKL